MKQSTVLHLLFLCLAVFTSNTEALALPKNARAMYNAPRVKNEHLYAKLSNVSFQRTSANQGAWKGLIHGNGIISLKLNVYVNNTLLYSRKIGAIEHKANEKPTPFKFVSAVPKNVKWSWKIVPSVK